MVKKQPLPIGYLSSRHTWLIFTMALTEPAVFLQALRKVAEAQGMSEVAKQAGIPRESQYRMLSLKGNPRWSTLAPVVRATGLKLEVTRP